MLIPCIKSFFLVLSLNKNITKGFFLDIGAYHPKFISNTFLLNKSNDLREMTNDEWLQYVKQAELYIVFASENGHKSESSVGHLAFLYDFEDVLFFDNIVTYYAIDFSDPETGKYDLVVITVPHNVFKNLGINKIRTWCNKRGSILDLKSTFQNNLVDHQRQEQNNPHSM